MANKPLKVGKNPSPVAPPVDPGPEGELHGRLEVQLLSDAWDIELNTVPLWNWGEGIFVPKAATGAKLGGQYVQEVNPDPVEWFAMIDPAAPAGTVVDVRVNDSRRRKVLQPRQTVLNIGGR
jgi:hypothetical protein